MSARYSLARIRTVTRWPGGTSGGGVHGCTAAELISAPTTTTLLQQDDLDAQLPMDAQHLLKLKNLYMTQLCIDLSECIYSVACR